MIKNSRLRVVLVVLFAVLTLVTGSRAVCAEGGLEIAMSLQRVFVDVAGRLKPSVVNIRVEKSVSGGIQWTTPGEDESHGAEEFFRRFFGGPGLRFKRPENFKTQAAGSGIIISEDGMILTNNHVIKDASKITVKLHDGREVDAEIIGQDPQTDMAVIKAQGVEKLLPAKFADSDSVEVGQWCIAVGNPLGLEQTVTVGVVSAVGRSGIGATTIEDFIQTDASINPGNSGGPLVNLHGKVIGVNTLIFNAPGSGIGFAIPSNMASRISSQIVKSGKVERPYIGITMQALTEDLASHFGLKDRDGAVVMKLIEDGPAEKAGLKAMDIIRKIDGRTMKNTNDVQKYVLSREVGGTIVLDILRNGKKEKISIKLEQMPQTYGLSPSESASVPQKGFASGIVEELGLTLQKMQADQLRGSAAKGLDRLVISRIKQGSPADKSGLQRGDIINQVNGSEVKEVDDVEQALKDSDKKGSSVFLVERGGIPMFVVVSHT